MARILRVGDPGIRGWRRWLPWILGFSALVGMTVWALSILILDEPSHWDVLYERYVADNEDAESGQIVFLGDSLTEGYLLGDFFESDLHLYNRGIAGDTTSGVIRRLEAHVLAISPSVIVLLIGVNDLHSGVSTRVILDNLEEIFQTVSSALPECEVYVESWYPTNTSVIDLSRFWDDIDAMNPQIETLTESFGYHFIDVHGSLSDGDALRSEYAVDGLHLNAAGYAVVSDALAAAIPELRRKP